ncbi:MAG: cbb3-type cytochrome c oxidase subunit I [Chloroflexi bacterium]|nr:cbb3-type cytochrome c oxidase subunit I [Chloroflexota bacterium]
MPRLSVWAIRAALVYLGIGFTVGGLMLFNKGVALDSSLWRLWPLHIELMLVGWTMQLAMAMAFWILPRLQRLERYGNTALAWLAFGLLNAGMLAVMAGEWFGTPAWLSVAGRGVELAAVVAFAVYIWPRVKSFGG